MKILLNSIKRDKSLMTSLENLEKGHIGEYIYPIPDPLWFNPQRRVILGIIPWGWLPSFRQDPTQWERSLREALSVDKRFKQKFGIRVTVDSDQTVVLRFTKR